MAAVGLTLLLYGAWWVVGLAMLAAARRPVLDLRLTLCAPMLGACLLTLTAFLLSAIGFPISDFGLPLFVTALVASAAVLARQRPHVPFAGYLTAAVALVTLVTMSAPMADLGFRWLANGNYDMANYVMGAVRLLDSSYNADLDLVGLLNGTNLAEGILGYHAGGVRPGSDVTLAMASALSGRTPLEVAMPVLTALQMAGTCAVGAMAAQASERRRAAPLAALLYALAPMAVYGLEQQLIAQVYGLGVGAALAAVIMHPEAYGGAKRPVVLAALLTASLAVVYVELGGLIATGYVVYLAIGLLRRRLRPVTLVRFWVPGAVLALAFASPYLVRGAHFLLDSVNGGFESADPATSLFSYMLSPNALAGASGVRTLIPPYNGADVDTWIVLGAVVIVLIAGLAITSALRGESAGAVLLAMLGIGVLLATRSGDFGLFKLSMYVAPFVAAVLAVQAVRTRWAGALILIPLAALWWDTGAEYVEQSRHPADVPQASSVELMPRLREVLDGPRPVVAANDNIVMETWMVGESRGTPLAFLSRDPVNPVMTFFEAADAETREQIKDYTDRNPWVSTEMPLLNGTATAALHFRQNRSALAMLRRQGCRLVLPGSATTVVNRQAQWSLDAVADVAPCEEQPNALAFVASAEGAHYYLGGGTAATVSFYQLETDPSGLSSTFSASGRYALFQVLNPSKRARLVLEMTGSFQPNTGADLPPAAVVGQTREPLDATGFGSARLTSPPVAPRWIDGAAYIALDMGRDPEPLGGGRSGLAALWGKNVTFDRRHAVGRVRSVSLVSDAQHRRSERPADVRFPQGLSVPTLAYSGISEEGWVGKESWVVLRRPAGARLLVRAEVPLDVPATCTASARFGDGTVVSRPMAQGVLTLRGPRMPRGRTAEKVSLRFTCDRPLPAGDQRVVSAMLKYVGFERP